MSTHRLSTGSAGSPPPRLQDHTLSWTDDLPVCHQSGVGFSTNQIYREDGFRREEHEFEDRSIHFGMEDISLYGVFDGHDGSRAAHFAAQRMPAELLLGQLRGKTTDEEVKEILNQAFISVEKGFFDSIDDALAEKAKLLLHVPEGLTRYPEIYHQYPEIFKQLQAAESEISGGTTAVLAAILNSQKLYIANVGCSRALLCKTDHEGVLRVVQLSVDHDLGNQEEMLRLQQVGVDTEKLLQLGQIGTHSYTRTIGNYNIKSGYKDMEALSSATSDPILAVPEVTSGLDITDPDFKGFLILMSYGLYKSLEDATGTEHVNTQIASMVASEFAVQTTLNGIAQAVVDQVVRIHHDTYMTSADVRKQLCQKRKDITLLVRNFNYPLPNVIGSPTASCKIHPLGVATATLNSGRNTEPKTANIEPLSVIIPPSGMKSPPATSRQFFFANTNTNTNTNTQTNLSTYSTTYTSSTNDSTQSGDAPLFQKKSKVGNELKLNEDGKVEAYVEFSEFYNAMAQMSESERNAFDAEMEPRPDYEAIPEESPLTPASEP